MKNPTISGLRPDTRILNDPALIRRGIASAAAAAGWQDAGDYWRYPVFDMTGAIVAWRKKAKNSAAALKYLWDGPKGSANYYHAPDLSSAIVQASGVLYIANGEPAVLAYHAAGIRNVLSWFGEGSVPGSLAADLRALKVRRVIYAPDADRAGFNSAVKVRDSIAGSWIDFEALDLRACVPPKGDFNDLWMISHCNAETAKNALQGLPALPLPAPVEKPAFKQAAPVTDKASLIAAIGRALELDAAAIKPNGYSRKNFKCLWHDDQQASAGFNWHTGNVHCFVCGEIPRAEVAARLNIDVSQYQTQPAPKICSTNTGQNPALLHIPPNRCTNQYQYFLPEKPAPRRSWWQANLIPHSHMAALLLTIDVKTTRIVETMHAAFKAGDLNPDGFTIPDLLAACPMDRSAGYRAIEKLEDLGLVANLGIEEKDNSTSPKFATHYKICDPASLKWSLFQRGIYPTLFKRYFAGSLPPSLPINILGEDELPDDAALSPTLLRELAAAFDHLATDTDRAQHSKFKSELKIWQAWLNDAAPLIFDAPADTDKTAYRAAILRAILNQSDPDTPHARRDLARMCGCSENTLDTLYKRLEVIPVPQWELVSLEAGDKASINAQYISAQKALRGKVMTVVVGEATTTPDDYEGIARAQERGEKVFAKLRVASKLRAMTEDERQHAAQKPQPEIEPDAADVSEEKPVITLLERWLRLALARMGYSLNQRRDVIARNGDTAAYEVTTNDLIDFILKARRLEKTA